MGGRGGPWGQVAEGRPGSWLRAGLGLQGEALLQKLQQLLDRNISLAVATSCPTLVRNSTDLQDLAARGRCPLCAFCAGGRDWADLLAPRAGTRTAELLRGAGKTPRASQDTRRGGALSYELLRVIPPGAAAYKEPRVSLATGCNTGWPSGPAEPSCSGPGSKRQWAQSF